MTLMLGLRGGAAAIFCTGSPAGRTLAAYMTHAAELRFRGAMRRSADRSAHLSGGVSGTHEGASRRFS